MKVIKKTETLDFDDKEIDAINLVCKICSALMNEATDPDLIELAEEIRYNLSELWKWEK